MNPQLLNETERIAVDFCMGFWLQAYFKFYRFQPMCPITVSLPLNSYKHLVVLQGYKVKSQLN